VSLARGGHRERPDQRQGGAHDDQVDQDAERVGLDERAGEQGEDRGDRGGAAEASGDLEQARAPDRWGAGAPAVGGDDASWPSAEGGGWRRSARDPVGARR
jgi:hypothetical protein